MRAEVIGIILLGVLLLVIFGHSRPAPKKGDYNLGKVTLPVPHLWKGKDDGDATIQIFNRQGQPLGTLLRDGKRLYDHKDGSLYAVETPHVNFVDYTKHDFGTFAAYQTGARGTGDDTFGTGIRYSPLRLAFGIVAPDAVITKDRGGIGFSLYAPDSLVGETASHIGLGAWYTVPFGGRDAAAPGWCLGISFSIR